MDFEGLLSKRCQMAAQLDFLDEYIKQQPEYKKEEVTAKKRKLTHKFKVIYKENGITDDDLCVLPNIKLIKAPFMCVICMSEERKGTIVFATCNRHEFCKTCLSQWHTSSKTTTCPTCRN
jgi:hypothetical protein